jgi:phenylacetate-CoA ligase
MKDTEAIKVIPFLTKEIIRNNFDRLKSTQRVKGGHYIATTGGSTGEPLKV